MQLYVSTEITTNTGKCQEVINAAINCVQAALNIHIIPLGLHTTAKCGRQGTRSWYSHCEIPKSLGKLIERYSKIPVCSNTPYELLCIYDYIGVIDSFNEQTTGDCQIHVSWVVG